MPLKSILIPWAALLGVSAFLSGCPPKSGPDTSPPGVNPVIQLGNPPPDTTNNGISIAAADVNRSGIPGNISIRVLATAADGESNVGSFDIVSNLTWQCSSGHNSPLIGVVQNMPLTFTPAVTQSGPAPSKTIDVVANPIAMTGCDTSAPGKGPVNIRGFIRLTAINGAGLTTTSKTFLFDYADVGSL